MRPVIYCIVPSGLADELHDPLREFYRDDPNVQVIVEQRATDRRAGVDRREAEAAEEPKRERRQVRARSGRRIDQRRAALMPVQPPELPEVAMAHVEELQFVERLEPSTQAREDADTARLIGRLQAGDREQFSRLYLRYFDRVYAYLRISLRDAHEAEDTTQDVFIRVLEALPSYERREVPFRAWLFRIVRNAAINRMRQSSRLTLETPDEMARHTETSGDMPAADSLEWLEDHQLVAWIEQLPLAQRQVIVLRYMLELKGNEIATVLDRTPEAVRQLHQRAMRFLRQRMGQRTPGGQAAPQRRSRPKTMTRRSTGSPVLEARRYRNHV
jgi:RNA polymerase sigma-70 factor (ECF subfamily)